MFRTLLVIMLLILSTSNAMAAAKLYHEYPNITNLPAASRMLIYDGTANKNITGSVLKSEILGGDGALVKQAPASATTGYERQFEVRDNTGKIVMWINAKGQQIYGTPKALAIDSVYPAPGATGVAIDTVPTVVVNKSAGFTIGTLYVQGDSTAPVVAVDAITWTIPITLTANTIYTITAKPGLVAQTDGETTTSCGPMTNTNGICTSTFTTAP